MIELLSDIATRVVAYCPELFILTQQKNDVLFLSQCAYEQSRCRSNDGWWQKTHDAWMQSANLSRDDLDGCRIRCRDWVKCEVRGSPPKCRYKLDAAALKKSFKKALQFAPSPQINLGIVRKSICAQSAGNLRPAPKSNCAQSAHLYKSTSTEEKQRKNSEQTLSLFSIWTKEYAKHHEGDPYVSESKDKEHTHFSTLLSSGYSEQDIIDVMTAAWSMNGFFAKRALTVRGFVKDFNGILDAVKTEQKEAEKKNSVCPLRG